MKFAQNTGTDMVSSIIRMFTNHSRASLAAMLGLLFVFPSCSLARPSLSKDADVTKKLVGQWSEAGRIRVFYGNGEYFVDPEPEGRPVGKWHLHNGVLSIFWPPGAAKPLTEQILTISDSRLVTVVGGVKHVYRRVNPY